MQPIVDDVPSESTRPGSQPERRCLVSGESGDRAGLVRFVVGPDDGLVVDVSERLPGRGMWVTADRAALATARRKNLFSRAARTRVAVPDDLVDRVERLLLERCGALLGLARRAGQSVCGYERVREWLIAGRGGVLLEAADGSPGECRKLRALAPAATVVAVLDGDELGRAFGRERTVHAVLSPGALADRFVREAARLAGVRGGGTDAVADGSAPSEQLT